LFKNVARTARCEVAQPQIDSQHLAAEKQQRTPGLVLRRSRDAALDRQIGEKSADLGFTHLTWVPFAMEQDEPLDPIQIGILGADAEVPHPSRAAHLLQEWGGALSMAHVANPPWRVYAALTAC